MLITPAFAQAAGGGDTNSMLMSLLPFALIFVIMYFLILRPQQKKVKDHAELVKNIRRGDTVVTTVSPRRMFFTSSAWSFVFFCCGRKIRKYMITKISANGSSDINMLLASPPAAAWANAGVISIRTILVKQQ